LRAGPIADGRLTNGGGKAAVFFDAADKKYWRWRALDE